MVAVVWRRSDGYLDHKLADESEDSFVGGKKQFLWLSERDWGSGNIFYSLLGR
jgi:hypothetical protein